jgi:hypothetical protein
MVLMLRECCCSFSLETGTFIIGIIEMVSILFELHDTECGLYVDVSLFLLGSPSRVVQAAKLVACVPAVVVTVPSAYE